MPDTSCRVHLCSCGSPTEHSLEGQSPESGLDTRTAAAPYGFARCGVIAGTYTWDMHRAVVAGRRRSWRTAVPDTRMERMRGLLGRASLPPDEALLLPGSRSIHTFGMRLAISVAWLDADARVIEVRRLPPSRLALPRRRGRDVLECAEGAGPEVGERLTIVRRRS